MARHVGKTTLAARVNIPFCIAAVLLCLTLISMYLTSGLFARYSTSAGDDDSARVAVFKVTNAVKYNDLEFVDNASFDIAPGYDAKYTVAVDNDSEVAVKCTISLVNESGNIETLSFDGSKEVTLAPGETGSCDIAITFPATNAELYMGMSDVIKVTVVAEQID